MAKETTTNIEVLGVSDRIHKDEEGFFVYIGAKGGPVSISGIKCYVSEEFKPHVQSLYRKEE